MSRKHAPTPKRAMIAPPAAGPIMRAAAATVELMEIARGSASRSTSSETKDWRVGTSSARARPSPSARTQTRGSGGDAGDRRDPEHQRECRLTRLRAEQQAALVDPVGDGARPRSEDEDRQCLERDGDAQRRARRRELQDQPRLRHRLQPRPRDRDQLAGEVQAVVAGGERSDT